MEVKTFIGNYREAFGEAAPLPLVFRYDDTPAAPPQKIGGCFFKGLWSVRNGESLALDAEVVGCGGGKFYCGFTGMPERVPDFVSLKERYKETPEMVRQFVETMEVMPAPKPYLNFFRIDQITRFEGIEGVLFFATPDLLSGLCSWTFFDSNQSDAVTSLFGSGCSSVIANAVRENRINGYRTFLGLFDPSVRPWVGEHELSFVIPLCRFSKMYYTMRQSCLFDSHAWQKVKARINALPE
ncbi:MAG: DUF169 domain-containing protein [Bacteroidales bacterium]